MATMITSECINCGACEPECPNNAISQGIRFMSSIRFVHRVRRISRLRGLCGCLPGRLSA